MPPLNTEQTTGLPFTVGVPQVSLLLFTHDAGLPEVVLVYCTVFPTPIVTSAVLATERSLTSGSSVTLLLFTIVSGVPPVTIF